MNCNLDSDEYKSIPKEKFVFVQAEKYLGDTALKTKPTGYFKDAMLRFVTNRGSVICFFIIVCLFFYAVFAPIFSPYKVNSKDPYYAYALPKNPLFAKFGIWDGCKKTEVNLATFQYYSNIPGALKKFYGEKIHTVAKREQKWYSIRLDSYAKVGWVKMLLSKDEWEKALVWEKESGRKLFYPIINQKLVKNSAYKNDMNAWFESDAKGIVKNNPPPLFRHRYDSSNAFL